MGHYNPYNIIPIYSQALTFSSPRYSTSLLIDRMHSDLRGPLGELVRIGDYSAIRPSWLRGFVGLEVWDSKHLNP